MEHILKAGNDVFKNYEDVIAYYKENVDAVIKSSSIAAKGAQDLGSMVADLTRVAAEEGMANTKKVLACKDVQEAVELQTALTKSGYEKFVADSTKLGEATTKLIEDSFKPLQARAEATMELAKKAA